MRDLVTEQRLRRLQQDAHATALAIQTTQQASVSPNRRCEEAMERLQETETYLAPESMAALVDLVSVDADAAKAYLSLRQEDYRKAWVSMRLSRLGYRGD